MHIEKYRLVLIVPEMIEQEQSQVKLAVNFMAPVWKGISPLNDMRLLNELYFTCFMICLKNHN